MVERCPNLKEEVGGSIPDCEFSSLLNGNLQGGQLPPVLWRWDLGLLSQTNKNELKSYIQIPYVTLKLVHENPTTNIK